MDRDDKTLSDELWDAQYFELIDSLAVKNASRYEEQARELLNKRVLKVECSGAEIEFKLTPLGCSFLTSDSQSEQSTNSWVRMGFRKSAKRKALPHYFAQAEATVLIDRQG